MKTEFKIRSTTTTAVVSDPVWIVTARKANEREIACDAVEYLRRTMSSISASDLGIPVLFL